MEPESTVEKVEESEDTEININVAEIMKSPELLAELSGLIRSPTDFVNSLPINVKRRVNALKNILVECANLEGKFYEEAHQLEMKYAEHFKPLYQKRTDIVTGAYEPSGKETVWVEPSEADDDDEGKTDEEEVEKISDEKPAQEKTEEEKIVERIVNQLGLDENTKGIPEFWLTAMKNVEVIGEMIQSHDEDVLKHLTDVKLIFTGKQEGDMTEDDGGMGFVLEFHFSPNPYFTNSTLKKTYRMKSVPDKDEPCTFDGPDIVACDGCNIDWKKGKNITRKQIKKKQRHKGRGQTRYVTKYVQNESFFNFFQPPESTEHEEDIDEETESILEADFEIGHFFRERFIPRAVLFYTGEAIEDESDEDDSQESSTEDDDDDDDEEEENDPDHTSPDNPNGKQEECKNQ